MNIWEAIVTAIVLAILIVLAGMSLASTLVIGVPAIALAAVATMSMKREQEAAARRAQANQDVKSSQATLSRQNARLKEVAKQQKYQQSVEGGTRGRVAMLARRVDKIARMQAEMSSKDFDFISDTLKDGQKVLTEFTKEAKIEVPKLTLNAIAMWHDVPLAEGVPVPKGLAVPFLKDDTKLSVIATPHIDAILTADMVQSSFGETPSEARVQISQVQ